MEISWVKVILWCFLFVVIATLLYSTFSGYHKITIAQKGESGPVAYVITTKGDTYRCASDKIAYQMWPGTTYKVRIEKINGKQYITEVYPI